MIRPRLHATATARTLASVRILVAVLWAVRIATDAPLLLRFLDSSLWRAYGIMRLLPQSLLNALLTETGLSLLRGAILVAAVAVALGLRAGTINLAALSVFLTVYFGLMKGFGGHVDHRELVLLYVTYTLILLPCTDALTIVGRRQELNEQSIYAASMMVLSAIVAFSYFFIGLARLAMGTPTIFHPDVLAGWLVSRSKRPNPYGFEIGSEIVAVMSGSLLLAVPMILSTLLELLSPLMLWARSKPRRTIIVGLVLFHVGVFLTMNISFAENIMLLTILWGNSETD